LPQNCQDTINEIGLTSLAAAINRTDLWDDLDLSPNYTCLGPNNHAFTLADNPQTTLNQSSLHDTMELHTIPQPLYTNYLQDGQEYQTDDNQTVRVRIVNGEIFFNDAMVIQPNIMYVICLIYADRVRFGHVLNCNRTNNGVIHVLDKVMSELQETNTSTPATPSATPSAACARSVLKRRYMAASWILCLVFPFIVFG